MSLKGKFPFSIGATSYTLADKVVPNVEFLSSLVDDIEIVLFESDKTCPLPLEGDVEKIAEVKRSSGLSFTIHLPLDLQLGHQDKGIRKQSIEQCKRIFQRMEPLQPFGYVFHCNRELGLQPDFNVHWLDRTSESLGALIDFGVEPEKICLETLDYSYTLLTPLIERYHVRYCLDIGHVIRYGFNPSQAIADILTCSRIVHIHGVKGKRDHADLRHFDAGVMKLLIEKLVDHQINERVVTLEVFSTDDLQGSLTVMEKYL